MSNRLIRSELETKLAAWAQSKSPAIPVSYENVSFTKPVGSPFVQCFLIPNATLNRETSGTKTRLIGLFQVNCWVPEGKGMGVPELLAQEICDLYPVVPKTGNVSIEQTPAIGKALTETGWVIVPVLVKYRYET